MCLLLDFLFEQIPCKELQTKLPLLRGFKEEIARIDDLMSRYVDVYHTEVLLETVAQEFATQV